MTLTTDSGSSAPSGPSPAGGSPREDRVQSRAWWAGPWQLLRHVYGWFARWPEWLLVGAFLLVLMLVATWTFSKDASTQLWMDEAITVGIASHPLSAIPGIMRMDGSPPLFYMLLHVWISIFGDTETDTHVLSILISVVTVPISYWGARVIFDKRTALFSSTLFATNAFLIAYSTETRMYALMVLFGLLTTVGYVGGFVFRRRWFLVLFAIGQTLMLYTHSWGLFFGAASFITLALVWRQLEVTQRRHFVRDVVCSYVAVAILYAPWLPTFLFQARHTAAPWDATPRFGLPLQIAQNVLGGKSIALVAVAIALYGVWRLLGRSQRRSPEARALIAMFTLTLLTFVLAWIASQITPAWVPRYFAPVVGSILLMVAFGLARARVVGILALLFACTTIAHTQLYAPQNKSNMHEIAGEMSGQLKPGDVVLVGQPEQTPLAYYYFPAGLKYANTAFGVLKDPSFVNWQNAEARYKAANPQKTLGPILSSLKVGQRLLYIQPLTEGNAQWIQPWTELIRLRSAQWGAIIAADKQLKAIDWAPTSYPGACCVADSAVLYQKVS
jgi:uncharacterized membrane protein